MKDVFNKISSYNILNYLIPGAIFWYLCPKFCGVSLPVDNIVGELVGFYFVGMIIYCIGSIIIEPLFRKLKIIRFSKYSLFVQASIKDTKLETLSESNNTFRTMIALCMSLALVKIYLIFTSSVEPWIMIAVLFFFFSIVYIKRSIYVSNRVTTVIEELKKENNTNSSN